MIWTETRCELYGEKYSPALAAKLTNLTFAEMSEPGELGTLGRYKGKPLPYGSSYLIPPKQLTIGNADYGTEWLAEAIARHRAGFEESGATDIKIRLDVYHDGQCNLEFSPRLLKRISDSGVTLVMSCYEDPDYLHAKMAEAEDSLRLES